MKTLTLERRVMPDGVEIFFDPRLKPSKEELKARAAKARLKRLKAWLRENGLWVAILVLTIWIGGIAPLIQAFH